jgi:hypothetical protein
MNSIGEEESITIIPIFHLSILPQFQSSGEITLLQKLPLMGLKSSKPARLTSKY